MDLARLGRLGKQQAFVEHLKPARAQLAALIERVSQQPDMLTAGLGPALWIATTESLVLNLNTAEADQLAALDASLAEWGGKIVVERDEHGPYGSLGDLAQRAGLPESRGAPRVARRQDQRHGGDGKVPWQLSATVSGAAQATTSSRNSPATCR
jgi:hypothetical protein